MAAIADTPAYAQATWVGDLGFVAGQVALDATAGQAMAGDRSAQTERVIETVRGIRDSAGTPLACAVENLWFLADVRRNFAAYGRSSDTDGPVRTTVQAVLPREGLLVEIRCFAVMPV